jgi:ribosomal protein S18 acetylase RimI-like enzyme
MDEIVEISCPHGALRLRPERDDDLAFRLRLFRDSRPELALLPLPSPMLDQVVDFQFRAQTMSYRAQFPRARFDIIELDGAPIGRIVVDRPGSAIHIVDQALTPQYRNRGLGSTIMGALMREAGEAGLPVRLTVAPSNQPSLRLYLRLGFRTVETGPTHIALEWRSPVHTAASDPPH